VTNGLIGIIGLHLLLLPAGFLLGQPFPLGIKRVRIRAAGTITWLWAVNGAASIVGSALATIIALRMGFRLVSLTGMLCYGVALTTIVLAWRDDKIKT
jgi:hypothetical protein